MNSSIDQRPSRGRLGFIGIVLALATAGWVLNGFGENQDKPVNPPAEFQVDRQPIQRTGHSVTSYAPIVKKASPSVVNIFTTTKPRRMERQELPWMDDPFFRRFFGNPFEGPEMRTPRQHGLGSGVIVTDDGYILTNNHVVDGADEIRVALNSDKKEFEARVVGKDPKSDIAVLKIEADGLPVAKLGDSESIEVGDVVLAIGNPFGIGQTVTSGIVSATGRATLGLDYEDFIQTDAAINPGNSGGALIDADGRLIGINTAILSRSGGNQGIGFAVPIHLARMIMESLIHNGRVVRGFLGVSIQNVTTDLAAAFDLNDARGALVSEVVPNSPADKAGLKNGDIIVEFDGKEIQDSRHLKLTVAQTPPDTKANVLILRDGKTKKVEVQIQEMTDTDLAMGGRSTQDRSTEEQLKGVGVADLDDAARQRFNIADDLEGALVVQVEPDSAAYEAGLRPGDVIREINRQPVRNAEDAIRLTSGGKDKVTLLRVWSRGGTRFLVVDES